MSTSANACPHCGGHLKFLEKDTSSGREYREYRCLGCGELVTLGGDVALWKMLHDANEQAEKQRSTAKKRRWWSWLRK